MYYCNYVQVYVYWADLDWQAYKDQSSQPTLEYGKHGDASLELVNITNLMLTCLIWRGGKKLKIFWIYSEIWIRVKSHRQSKFTWTQIWPVVSGEASHIQEYSLRGTEQSEKLDTATNYSSFWSSRLQFLHLVILTYSN